MGKPTEHDTFLLFRQTGLSYDGTVVANVRGVTRFVDRSYKADLVGRGKDSTLHSQVEVDCDVRSDDATEVF